MTVVERAATRRGDPGLACGAGATGDTREISRAVAHFTVEFGDIDRWRARSCADRITASLPARASAAFAAFAAVRAGVSVDGDYVVASASKWGRHVAVA